MLFKDLGGKQKILMLGMLALMAGASQFCLRTGRVKVEDLEANKKTILEEALSAKD
jgi:hypothetical protein